MLSRTPVRCTLELADEPIESVGVLQKTSSRVGG